MIPSLVPRPSIRTEGGSGEYSSKFLSTAEFRRYESDWSIRVTHYSHPQIPTQTSESASTSYLLARISLSVHRLYKCQGSCCCWDDARVAVSANNHGSLSRGETSEI